MNAQPLVLLIEDAADIREVLCFHLIGLGARVHEAASGASALSMLRSEKPHLILLDLMLPDIDGISLCRRLKSAPVTSDISIIILTAKGEDCHIVAGLEAGADDYVTKPFTPTVLMARVRSALRRCMAVRAMDDEPTDETFISGELLIRPARHEVWVDGERCPLTSGEFRLLWRLAHRPGLVFTRNKLREMLGGVDTGAPGRSIDVQIMSLRRKLGPVGTRLETIRGVGYRFTDTDEIPKDSPNC